MPTSDKTVKVTLVAVATPYAKGMADASIATRKLGAEIDGTSAKTKGLETGMGRASGAVKGLAIGVGALAATSLVSFLKDAVQGASDLSETAAKAGQIFGKDALPALQKFANGAADAMGQSKQEALDAAATFGVFGKSAGKTGDDLVNFSTQMVQLSGDIASFANTSPEEAITAIGAALRGESEPIRKYGILLDDALLRQRALKLGIIETTKQALTPQQRVLAAQAEILAQTSDAQGDFARTSSGLANQQRILAAEWANAKTELGEGLLPAVTETVKALRGGVSVAVAAGHAFNEIPGPVKAAIAALVIYKLTNDKIATGVGAARDSIKRMREELALQSALANGISGGYQRLGDEAQTAGTKVSRTALGLGVASKAARGAGSALLGAFGGPVGLAVTGLTVAIGIFASKQQEAKGRVDELRASLDKQTGAITDQTRELAAQDLQRSGLLAQARELGVSSQLLVRAYSGEADALRQLETMQRDAEKSAATLSTTSGDLEKQFGLTGGAALDLSGASDSASQSARNQSGIWAQLLGEVRPMNQQMADLAKAQVEVGTAAGTATDTENTFAAATKEVTVSAEDQAKAIRDAAQAVLDATKAKTDAFDAEIAYQASLDDTAAALKENGKQVTRNGKVVKDNGDALDLNTKKGRDNASALKDQADKAKALAEQNVGAGASLKSVRDEMDAARAAFIANAEKAGLSKTAAEKMATAFGLTKGTVDNLAKAVKGLPASKQIKIEAETAAAAARLKLFKEQLAGIKSKSVVVTTYGRFVNTGPLPNGGKSTAGGSTFADGGHVRGPGTWTSDSIPALLSDNEYVVRAAAVAKYGTSLLNDINSMRFAEGGSVRYGSRQQIVMAPSSGPAQVTETTNAPIHIGSISGPSLADIEREARQRARFSSLTGGNR